MIVQFSKSLSEMSDEELYQEGSRILRDWNNQPSLEYMRMINPYVSPFDYEEAFDRIQAERDKRNKTT